VPYNTLLIYNLPLKLQHNSTEQKLNCTVIDSVTASYYYSKDKLKSDTYFVVEVGSSTTRFVPFVNGVISEENAYDSSSISANSLINLFNSFITETGKSRWNRFGKAVGGLEMSMELMFCAKDSLGDELLRRGYQNYYANIDTEYQNKDSYLSGLPSEIVNEIKNYLKSAIQKGNHGSNSTSLLLGRQGWKKPRGTKEEVKKVFTYDNLSWDVGDEVFTSMELFFQPNLFNLETASIQEIITEMIRCFPDSYVQESLYQNILLVGGVSSVKGFAERLKCELTKLNNGKEPGLVAPEGREYAAWRGASMMSQTDILTRKSEVIT